MLSRISKKNIYIIIFFLIIAIIAYWQIFLLQYGLKWDSPDADLPWRFHVGECLQNNYFPYWNPYQETGYPIHAHLQVPLWNPEVYLTGFFFGYSNISFHFLYLIYFVISAYGMFRLTEFLGAKREISVIIGTAYILSGFFISHAQGIYAITAAAWLPLALMYYLKTINNEFKIRNILKTGIFLFLLVSSGYQAISIIFFYLLIIIFLDSFITSILKKNRKKIKEILFLHFIIGIIVLLLIMPLLISLYRVFPYIARFEGLNLEKANYSAFTPQSLISLFTPFAVIKEKEFFATDLTMANIYSGIIILIFFISAIFQKQKKLTIIILIFGIVSLFASFGDSTPIREFLFRYVPLMNLFSYPSFFKYFMMLAIFIMSAIYISKFTENLEHEKKKILIISILFLLILFSLLIFSITKINFREFSFLNSEKDFFQKFHSSTIYENIFIHSVIQIVIISIFISLLLKQKQFINSIFILILIEMTISVQLNMFETGVSETTNPIELRNKIEKRPNGFPIPSDKNIGENTDVNASFYPLWHNTNTFNKSVSFDNYSSFQFNNFNILNEKYSNLRDSILQNKIVYLSDKLRLLKGFDFTKKVEFSSKDLFVEDSIFLKFKNRQTKNSKTDSIYIKESGPNSIEIITKTKNEQFLTLLQNDYKGWNVFIDNKRVEYFNSNLIYMTVILPYGNHIVKFEYKNENVKIAFIISVLLFFILILILIFLSIKKDRKSILLLSISTILILIIFLFQKEKNANRNINFKEKIFSKTFENIENIEDSSEINNYKIIFNTDNKNKISDLINTNKLSETNYKILSLRNILDLKYLIKEVENSSSKYFIYSSSNVMEFSESEMIIKEKYSTKIYKEKSDNYIFAVYSKKQNKRFNNFSKFENFEKENKNLDSTLYYSGKYSLKIDSSTEFTNLLTKKANKIFSSKNIVINISLKTICDKNKDVIIVIQADKGNKSKLWNGRNISNYILKQNAWNSVFYTKEFSENDFNKNAEIKIYIWNKGKTNFNIDDYKIEICQKFQ